MKVNRLKLDVALANACMTTDELSIKSGVSRSLISRIRNERLEPKPQTVGKIAKGLGVKVEELV